MSANLTALFANHLQVITGQWQRQLAISGHDGVVIFAGERQPIFMDDKYYPFKINPHFQHWVPLAQPVLSALIFVPGQRPRLLFHAPADYWESTENALEDYWAKHMDIEPCSDKAALAQALSRLPRRMAWVGQTPSFPLPDAWAINPQDVVHAIHYARAIKTDYEQECLRGAARQAAVGHKAAEQAFRAGASEFEIHLAFLAATAQTENDLPYQSIICLNENAACLHYRGKSRQRLPAGQLRSFLIDAGGMCRGYTSDVTRSYAAAAGTYADLVQAVDGMQQKIVQAARPGADYVALNRLAHGHIAEILRDFNLVDMATDDMVESGVTWTFLPHGLGHFIGLQVHDPGGHMASPAGDLRPPPASFPYLRLTRVLEAGHTLTIEPGIYFIPMLLQQLRQDQKGKYVNWSAVESLLPYGGVRIEDNVLITPSGVENMTRAAWG